MLNAAGQSAWRTVEDDEVGQARNEECQVHGAMLPVLQVIHLKAPLLAVQVPVDKGQLEMQI
jgi:hypothetical protein